MALTAAQIASLRASLSTKLRVEARRRGVAADLVRKQYVFTLFLAQLFHDDDAPWVLLGGNALLIRTGRGRFTRDVDLARDDQWQSAEGVLEELRDLLSSSGRDSPFVFALNSITQQSVADDDGYGAATAKVQAEALLGGRSFETFSIDLTTRRHTDVSVDQVPLNRIIDHESLNGLPTVPTVPVENHLADKICALYERHGVTRTASTRYRDLADIVRIVMGTQFSAARLLVILKREAGRRRIVLPEAIISPDDSWFAAFPRAAREFAEYPADLFELDASLTFAGHCLDEVLGGVRHSGSWNPETGRWDDSPS